MSFFPCQNGPLHGRSMARNMADDRLQIHEEEDESLHLYRFNPITMQEAEWQYVGEVIKPEDMDILKRAEEHAKEISEERIRELVRDEMAKNLLRSPMLGPKYTGEPKFPGKVAADAPMDYSRDSQ